MTEIAKGIRDGEIRKTTLHGKANVFRKNGTIIGVAGRNGYVYELGGKFVKCIDEKPMGKVLRSFRINDWKVEIDRKGNIKYYD